jgi:hypothetical protein
MTLSSRLQIAPMSRPPAERAAGLSTTGLQAQTSQRGSGDASRPPRAGQRKPPGEGPRVPCVPLLFWTHAPGTSSPCGPSRPPSYFVIYALRKNYMFPSVKLISISFLKANRVKVIFIHWSRPFSVGRRKLHCFL